MNQEEWDDRKGPRNEVSMTLQELAEFIQELILTYGEDSLVDLCELGPDRQRFYMEFLRQYVVDRQGQDPERPWRSPHPDNWISLMVSS